MWKRINFSFKCNEETLRSTSVFLLGLQTRIQQNPSFHIFQEDLDSPYLPISIIPSWSKGEIQWGATWHNRGKKDRWPDPFLLQKRGRGIGMHIQTDTCAPPTPAQALQPVTERCHVMNHGVHWCTPLTWPQASTDIASKSRTTQQQGCCWRLDEGLLQIKTSPSRRATHPDIKNLIWK